MRPHDPDLVGKLYDWLKRCAAEGSEAPASSAMVERFAVSKTTIWRTLQEMERRDLIRIHTARNVRQFEILATGQRTYLSPRCAALVARFEAAKVAA